MAHDFKFEVVPLEQVAETPGVRPDEEPPVVLVVDDEPLIVDSLAAILNGVGIVVLKAYDGASAVQVAMANPPNLLVTDVAMPGMNGIELAMTVAGALPACRVLLFSGHASLLDLRASREAGFDFTLLAKPVHPKEMVRRIFGCLNLQPRHPRVRESERSHLHWTPSQMSM